MLMRWVNHASFLLETGRMDYKALLLPACTSLLGPKLERSRPMQRNKLKLLVLSILLVAVPRLTAQISPNDYYGPGVSMDGIGNFYVAPINGGYTQMDYRFRAT